MKKAIFVFALLLVGCSSAPLVFESPIAPIGDIPSPGDTALLQAAILLFVNGGLAGYLVYKLLETPIGEKARKNLLELLAPVLGVGPALVGRVVAVILSASLSLVFYAVGMGFGFFDNPGDLGAWLNLALYLGGISFPVSQLGHGVLKDNGDGR